MVKIEDMKGKCEMCKKYKANSFIRQKQVCPKCFDILNKDNYKRMGQGAEIPKKLNLLAAA